jgi:hypothetical protein
MINIIDYCESGEFSMAEQEKLTDFLSSENAGLKARTQRFLDEIKARGTYKKIYEAGHTYAMVKSLNITYLYFCKLLERMNEGKGLYSNPLLLRAVLHDTGYPPGLLFGEEADYKPIEANLVLGPGTAQEIQRIIAHAVLNAEKPMRQLGIKRRINAAFTVLFIAKSFQMEQNYNDAIKILFLSYSISHLSLYPHGRVRAMKSIDALAKYHLNALDEQQEKLLGSVLVLAFIIFEIARMTYSLLAITERCRNLAEDLQPNIIGFMYENNEYPGKIKEMVKNIDEQFSSIVRQATAGDRLPSFVIPKYTLNSSIELLEKLLSFEVTTQSDNSKDELKDFIFRSVINLDIKNHYHISVKVNNDLFQQYDKYLGNPPALPGDSKSLTFPGI